MSLTCGIYALHPRTALPNSWRLHLRARLNRGDSGTIAEFNDRRLFALKLDINAFDSPGWTVDDRHVTALSGDGIFTSDGEARDRADDMATLALATSAELRPILLGSRGYFNLVRYDRADGSLILAVDRVGVRSLYIYSDGNVLVFAGAIRLIESLPGIRLTVDLRGVFETASFGVPLGERTRYREVQCLRGGTLLRFGNGQEIHDRYWKFDRDACTQVTPDIDTTVDALYAEFGNAVALRAGRRKAVFSALSGGLDSRGVTAELRRLGLDVHAINVSWPNSQDDVLGRMVAEKLGVTYHHAPRPIEESGNSLSRRLCRLLSEKAALCVDLPSIPRQLWSGNGGSLGIGHTKMTREATSLLNAGDAAGAASHFIHAIKFNLSGKLLRGSIARWAEALPFSSLMAEIDQIHCAEPARTLYVFRMEHDQRRLLAFHFEQIDLVPFEFVEPLFDPEVLRIACRLPMDYCLYHHMYHDLLKRFPPEVLSVPWQVYPGHEPCPIPLPPRGIRSMEDTATDERASRPL